MASKIMIWSVLTILMVWFPTGRGVSLSIDISPVFVIEKTGNTAQISCTPVGSSDDVSKVVVMVILKDQGKVVATTHVIGNKLFVNGPETHLKAQGHVDKDFSKCFLNLTLSNLTPDDTGRYTCTLYYQATSGMFKTLQASANFAVGSSSLPQMVKRIQDSLAVIKNDIKELTSKESTAKARVDALEQKADKNTLVVNELAERVAFYAIPEANRKYSTGDDIVFSKVIMNLGQGYDKTTGFFTCPTAGLYSFHFVIMLNNNYKSMDVKLMVNGNSVAKLGAGDDDYNDQTSVSAVVLLDTGDRVHLVVHSADGRDLLGTDKTTGFSGFLVKPMI